MLVAIACRARHCCVRRFSNFNSNLYNKNMENGEPALKKKTITIGTHSGIFHCDDALACYLLKLLPEYADSKIVRTRDSDILDGCDIVVDVGGIYDPAKHRYDHHQKTFTDTINTVNPLSKKFDIKLSSAGLIFAHFGETIISQKTNLTGDAVKSIYEKIYEYFIQEIDAIDNGVPISDGKQNYRISTNVSSRVANLNPQWNAPSTTKPLDELFEDAMELVGSEFMECVNYYSGVWWPAKSIVKESIKNRFKVHPSGKIIELDSFAPWKQHFFDLESEMGVGTDILFCIYKDKDWRVIGVPLEPSSFLCRLFLKEEWRGLRDDELSKLSGIPDCVFCHHTGFIGGNLTREGVLQMALKSIEAK